MDNDIFEDDFRRTLQLHTYWKGRYLSLRRSFLVSFSCNLLQTVAIVWILLLYCTNH